MIVNPDQNNQTSNYVDSLGNVYILGNFDETISQNVIPELLKRIYIEKEKPDGKLWFYINSPGGYCHELYNLLTLIDIAKSMGIKIYTIVMGNAFSCGSILAIHGDYRTIFKYGKHLVHLGSQYEKVSTIEQINRSNKNSKEHFENIIEMYKKHTKMPEKMIRKLLEDDMYYMNAEECKKYGLVDEIIGEKPSYEEININNGEIVIVNGVPLKITFKNTKTNKNKKNNKKEDIKNNDKKDDKNDINDKENNNKI